jgi:ribosome biogenesis GTPase
MTSHSDLAALGWNAFFASQLKPDDSALLPVRVMAVHRDRLQVAAPGIDTLIPSFPPNAGNEEGAATVGDWLLFDPNTRRPERLLARKSLFKRRAAGTGRRIQLIAANVDTLFIVSSCNQDFSPARLERYLALAGEAEVMPVVILTKADLTDRPEDFAREVADLLPGLLVEVLDARDSASVARLAHWCGPGQTVALIGSSGVGKSTLINTLTGADRIATQDIRAHDETGQHTTSARSLHRLPAGGWLVDTPGIRELQLTDARAGIKEVFADLVEVAAACRFSNCRHESEPGCAVRAAIESGVLDPVRIKRWRKLTGEETPNSGSLAVRRTRNRTVGKTVRSVIRKR